MIDHRHIVALAVSGKPPKEIVRIVGCTHSQAYAAIRAGRKAGANIPYFAKRNQKSKGGQGTSPATDLIAVPMRLKSLLKREAERRNLTETETAQRLLEDALLGKVVAHD